MSYSALFENGATPKWAIGGNEVRDTQVLTDFYCVYDKQFVVGDDMYRIFDPMVLTPVTGAGTEESPYTSPIAREYIVEVTGNGFFNLHHRMPIALGKFQSDGEDIVIGTGWRLPDALLPDGVMPTLWPIGYGYGLLGSTSLAESVVWLFNDLYDKTNFSSTIAMSSILSSFVVEKNISWQSCTAEFIQKMTTDSYTHQYFALGTSLGISKHTDGNNEDVTVRVRLLRRQLPESLCTNLVSGAPR